MRITCPHCGFCKELPAEKVPANVVRVTCPDCRQPFPLTREATMESAPTIENVATDTVESTASIDDRSTAAEPARDVPDMEPAAEAVTISRPENATVPESALLPGVPSATEAGRAPESGTASEPAGIGARYAALLIDSMLILIMVLILRSGLTLLGNGIRLEGQILLGMTFMLFALVLGFAYHTLFIGACGQTPGKMLLRIRVIATGEGRMTWSRAMLRELFGKTLSAPLLLGYAMALFHPQRLAAHDKIADTCVVKHKP